VNLKIFDRINTSNKCYLQVSGISGAIFPLVPGSLLYLHPLCCPFVHTLLSPSSSPRLCILPYSFPVGVLFSFREPMISDVIWPNRLCQPPPNDFTRGSQTMGPVWPSRKKPPRDTAAPCMSHATRRDLGNLQTIGIQLILGQFTWEVKTKGNLLSAPQHPQERRTVSGNVIAPWGSICLTLSKLSH
jgi:hypothetical protein